MLLNRCIGVIDHLSHSSGCFAYELKYKLILSTHSKQLVSCSCVEPGSEFGIRIFGGFVVRVFFRFWPVSGFLIQKILKLGSSEIEFLPVKYKSSSKLDIFGFDPTPGNFQ